MIKWGHRCRISHPIGFGYQEIGFSYQEILPGISRAFRKWTCLIAISACFWPQIYKKVTLQWEILKNKSVKRTNSSFGNFYNFLFVFSEVLISIMPVFSQYLPVYLYYNTLRLYFTRSFDLYYPEFRLVLPGTFISITRNFVLPGILICIVWNFDLYYLEFLSSLPVDFGRYLESISWSFNFY